MTTHPRSTYNVGVLLYPGADVLDYAGPIEVLSSALYPRDSASASADPPRSIFRIETIGRDDLSTIPTGRNPTKVDCLTIKPSRNISHALAHIGDYDILIVPGGGMDLVRTFMPGSRDENATGPEIELIKAFASAAEPGPYLGKGRGKERVLLSVCTGAILLASAGVLTGVESTTHHFAYDVLATASMQKTTVVKGKRYVDAGAVREGLRVITSGGVISGIDSTIYLLDLLAGQDVSDYVVDVMEYDRHGS